MVVQAGVVLSSDLALPPAICTTSPLADPSQAGECRLRMSSVPFYEVKWAGTPLFEAQENPILLYSYADKTFPSCGMITALWLPY